MLHFQRHNDYVKSVAYSPDGNTFASGHTKFVTSVVFSPDGSTLACGS